MIAVFLSISFLHQGCHVAIFPIFLSLSQDGNTLYNELEVSGNILNYAMYCPILSLIWETELHEESFVYILCINNIHFPYYYWWHFCWWQELENTLILIHGKRTLCMNTGVKVLRIGTENMQFSSSFIYFYSSFLKPVV